MGLKKSRSKNKFRAIKVTIDGIRFDSKKEAEYYKILKTRVKRGEIKDLQVHVTYGLYGRGGSLICRMKPDFQYTEKGRTVIDEVKSRATITPSYRLKKKLFRDNYPTVVFNEIL